MSEFQVMVYFVACFSTGASILINKKLSFIEKLNPVMCISVGFLIVLLKIGVQK